MRLQTVGFTKAPKWRSSSCFASLVLFFAIIISVSPPLIAQTLYGTLTGSVSDAAGAKVPGATVSLKNVDTGYSRTATSDDSGGYQVTDLQPGRYDIVISAPTFGDSSTRGVSIGANQTQRIDVTMSVAGGSADGGGLNRAACLADGPRRR